MPSLIELNATFIRYEKGIAGEGHGRPHEDGTMQWGGFEVEVHRPVEQLSEAQGINFLCPLCFQNNNGPIGTHLISISFEDRGVLPEHGSHNPEGPTRWKVESGTGLHDLCLSPSILLAGPGCGWHGFVGHAGVPPGHAQ